MRLSNDLNTTIERYHGALDEFARGDPGPMKALFSEHDDVTLANPFGPAVRGAEEVRDALDYASSRFRDGTLERAESLATYATDDLATILEIEHWRARVGESEEMSSFVLRASSTLRREGERWKLVHRHADPIATPDPMGPLRR